jgi:hypothetical protein
LVVEWLYGFSSSITGARASYRVSKKIDFQGRFDILFEVRLSGVAKQGYTMLYGKSQLI